MKALSIEEERAIEKLKNTLAAQKNIYSSFEMLVRNPNKRSALGNSAAPQNKTIETGSSKTARSRNKFHYPAINRTMVEKGSLGSSGGASSLAKMRLSLDATEKSPSIMAAGANPK